MQGVGVKPRCLLQGQYLVAVSCPGLGCVPHGRRGALGQIRQLGQTGLDRVRQKLALHDVCPAFCLFPGVLHAVPGLVDLFVHVPELALHGVQLGGRVVDGLLPFEGLFVGFAVFLRRIPEALFQQGQLVLLRFDLLVQDLFLCRRLFLRVRFALKSAGDRLLLGGEGLQRLIGLLDLLSELPFALYADLRTNIDGHVTTSFRCLFQIRDCLPDVHSLIVEDVDLAERRSSAFRFDLLDSHQGLKHGDRLVKRFLIAEADLHRIPQQPLRAYSPEVASAFFPEASALTVGSSLLMAASISP